MQNLIKLENPLECKILFFTLIAGTLKITRELCSATVTFIGCRTMVGKILDFYLFSTEETDEYSL
jgi:hypothetical protein